MALFIVLFERFYPVRSCQHSTKMEILFVSMISRYIPQANHLFTPVVETIFRSRCAPLCTNTVKWELITQLPLPHNSVLYDQRWWLQRASYNDLTSDTVCLCQTVFPGITDFNSVLIIQFGSHCDHLLHPTD